MVNIIKEELPIAESLRKKLELICEFAKTTPKIINSNIRKIDRTNLTYIEPNRIIIKDKTFLIFNYSNEVFIENFPEALDLTKNIICYHIGQSKGGKLMIDNFGKGGFGLDQLTELIPTEPSEADREQTKRILEAKRREFEKYLIEHPEVVAVHSVPQPKGTFHGRVYERHI